MQASGSYKYSDMSWIDALFKTQSVTDIITYKDVQFLSMEIFIADSNNGFYIYICVCVCVCVYNFTCLYTHTHVHTTGIVLGRYKQVV